MWERKEILSELDDSDSDSEEVPPKRVKYSPASEQEDIRIQLQRIEQRLMSPRHAPALPGGLPAHSVRLTREETNKQQLQDIMTERLHAALLGKTGWTAGSNRLIAKRKKLQMEEWTDTQVTNYIATVSAVGRADSMNNYLSSLRAWMTFCEEKQHDWRSPSDVTFLHFAVWRYSGGLRVTSLEKEFGKIRTLLADSGIVAPKLRDMPAVKGLLKGMKILEDHDNPKERRYPLTTCHLQDMLRVLPECDVTAKQATVMGAMWKVMYFGLLRIGEALTKRKGSGQGWTEPLRWRHVTFFTCAKTQQKYAVLRLPPSKTDKTGIKYKIVLPRLEEQHASICPVRALETLLDDIPIGTDVNDWEIFENKTHGVKFTYDKYTRILKEALRKANYDDSLYHTHSWRIGAATVARALGFSKEDIKMLGRWESDCWKVYTRPVLEHQGAITARLQDWQHKLTFA
jgi:hypothetical protein